MVEIWSFNAAWSMENALISYRAIFSCYNGNLDKISYLL